LGSSTWQGYFQRSVGVRTASSVWEKKDVTGARGEEFPNLFHKREKRMGWGRGGEINRFPKVFDVEKKEESRVQKDRHTSFFGEALRGVGEKNPGVPTHFY